MNQHKFRAYIKRLEKVYPVTAISFYEQPGSYAFIRYVDEKGLHQLEYMVAEDDVTLLEYTGLLDKNGKEIYEGDIVTCEGFGGTYTIEYEGCAYIGRHNESSQWVDIEMQELTIIGNIYETPNLLGEGAIK